MNHKIKIIYSILAVTSVIFSFIEKSAAVPLTAFIDNVNPPMNAVSVNKSSNITVVFTQPMNASTINNANIKVFGYKTGLLSAAISYNQISKTLIINPNQDMKIGEEISVTLTNGITTEGGQSITPFVYKFTIQALGGNGIFVKTSGIPIQGGVLKSGDIDGDGDIDLIVTNLIYKNNGFADFTFFVQLSVSGFPELADFDNDGDLDILIQNGNIVYFYENDGTGHFMQTYNFTGAVSNFGDLDGNGFLDCAYYDPSNNLNLTVRKNNNGLLTLDTSFNFTQGCLGDYRDRVLIDDFNNDGIMDMIGIHGFRVAAFQTFILCRNYEIFKNNTFGKFTQNHFYELYMDGLNFFTTDQSNSKSFDFNNDGFVDILSSQRRFTNNHDGTFLNSHLNMGFSSSTASDYTGDGSIDMINSWPSATYMQEYVNDGEGNFTQQMFSTSPFYGGSMTDGDFDNDGDIDVAIVLGSEVGIFINSDIPQPVELSSFNSTVNSNTVTLNWTTAMEKTNSGFDVERRVVRSETQDVWNKIGFVQGNGNSNNSHSYSFADRNLQSGKYKYRLKQIDFNGNFKYYNLSGEVVIGVPSKMSLSQNYPNPFNPKTIIRFNITPLNPPFEKGGNGGFVQLKIYNSVGKEVITLVNEKKEAGYYEVSFDGSNLPSGMYFYRLSVDGNTVDTKRMALVK